MASAQPLPMTARRRSVLSRALIVTTALVAGGFLTALIQNLYREWQALQHEEAGERSNRVIGYVNINPEPSLARPPANWVHDEGDSTFIWSGWTPGTGHGWFRVGRGEIDRARLGWPMGR